MPQRFFLPTTSLKRKVVLYFLNQLEPVRSYEVFSLIQPYVVLHRINFVENAFVLPETNPLLMHLNRVNPELMKIPTRRNIIYYSDIIYINELDGMLEIALKTGCAYLLSANSSNRKYVDVYPEKKYPNAGRILLWWWVLCENMVLCWWKMKEYIRCKLREA